MGRSDELMVGAIDMHCHAVPEFNKDACVRFCNEDILRQVRDADMGGIVLKSHLWPTELMAQPLRCAFTDIHVIGSTTLNASAGGVVPWAVEAAALLGAKVVWLPTWSAQNDIDFKAASKGLQPYLPSVSQWYEQGCGERMTKDGVLTRACTDVIAACKERDMVLCSGHISKEESMAVARTAKSMGFHKFIFTHPDSPMVGADLAFIKEMAELGAYIELSAAGLTPVLNRVTPTAFAQVVESVGAERCVLSTDYFHEWSPAVPEQYRLLINCLLIAGVSEENIRVMSNRTPRALLGLV